MDKALDDVVSCILNSKEYKECVSIKEKMNNNTEITTRINKIKQLQKKYMRTLDLEVEKELNILESELDEIPIYHIYNENLNKVNEMISYVNDELNDYFYKLLNE